MKIGIQTRAIDVKGDRLTTTNPLGHVTTAYLHDGLDNLIQDSSPDVGTTTHLYNAAGNRIQSSDANGVVVQHEPVLNFVREAVY